jgi:hypothetical protein
MGKIDDIFAKALAKAKAEGDANPVLGHVAPGPPETPLTNELFAREFYHPDCSPLLRCVLGKHPGDRSIEEHLVFTGWMIGLLEAALRGELEGVADDLVQPSAQAKGASRPKTSQRKRRSKSGSR